jgi:hypothetical protein
MPNSAIFGGIPEVTAKFSFKSVRLRWSSKLSTRPLCRLASGKQFVQLTDDAAVS